MSGNLRFRSFALIALFPFFLLFGCNGRNNTPVNPENPGNESAITDNTAQSNFNNPHYLWGYYLVKIDPGSLTSEIIPVREATFHQNILKYLEQTPCTDCFKISNITPGPLGIYYFHIVITHPFSTPLLTGFDVRGIAMFNGSKVFPVSGLNVSDSTQGDGELLNADGFTTLYNPTTIDHGPFEGNIKGKYATDTAPNATLNGFKRFKTEYDPLNHRNAFYAGSLSIAVFKVKIQSPVIFGYAVDASWAPPIHKPVTDPLTDFGPEANCTEAWKIKITDAGPGLTNEGGETNLLIDVYDWQGKDDLYAPLLECPELFDGQVVADWDSDGYDILDGCNYTRYKATVYNSKMASVGKYKLLVSKEAVENDPLKPWLDLKAYQVFDLEVSSIFNPTDVTPDWLNFGFRNVAIDGTYAYCVGSEGLMIYEITDPENPVEVKLVEFPHGGTDIAISGGFAYVTCADYCLRIIHIDPPESASIYYEIDTTAEAKGVDVSGGYAYVAAGDYGLEIIDIDSPSPSIIKQVTVWHSNNVAVDGGYAYLVCDDGFFVIDIDPIKSASIVSYTEIYCGMNIDLQGGYAYVTDCDAGLIIFDINTPVSPSIAGTVPLPSSGFDVAVSGEYSYVASENDGLIIIDSDPPESASIINTVDMSYGTPCGVNVSGDYAFVASCPDLNVVDIAPPESATVVKNIWSLPLLNDVEISNGNILALTNGDTVRIIDFDSPDSLSIINNLDVLKFGAYALTAEGGYAYIANYYQGLEIADIDPPESASSVTVVPISGNALDVAVSDGYAYVAAKGTGLHIVDIDPPETASLVNSVPTPGEPRNVAVSGGYAYVADSISGLEIIDIDPPESASIINNVNTLGPAFDVALSGDYAFVANPYHGLQIIGVNPPESASIINTVILGGAAQELCLSGGYAFVTTLGTGPTIIDIDPPESASFNCIIESLVNCSAVTVSGDYAFIINYYKGLRIIKLS